MANILYYPGCTVKRNAVDYEKTSIAILEKIGFKVIELNKWYCCGTLFNLTLDEVSKHLGAVRVLISAQKESFKYNTNKLLTLCPMCFNVLKCVNSYLIKYRDKLDTVTKFVDEEEPYKLGVDVKHIVEILVENADLIKKNIVVKPTQRAVTVYYGCTIVRPREIGIDNPEDPVIVEKFLRELGFNVIDNPYKTLCCGSYQILIDKNIVYKNSEKIIGKAVDRNALLITCVCPLCLYNLRETLDTMKGRVSVNVVYLTDLIAYILGLHNVIDENTLSFLKQYFSPNSL